jgi:hypothetical protein
MSSINLEVSNISDLNSNPAIEILAKAGDHATRMRRCEITGPETGARAGGKADGSMIYNFVSARAPFFSSVQRATADSLRVCSQPAVAANSTRAFL